MSNAFATHAALKICLGREWFPKTVLDLVALFRCDETHMAAVLAELVNEGAIQFAVHPVRKKVVYWPAGRPMNGVPKERPLPIAAVVADTVSR